MTCIFFSLRTTISTFSGRIRAVIDPGHFSVMMLWFLLQFLHTIFIVLWVTGFLSTCCCVVLSWMGSSDSAGSACEEGGGGADAILFHLWYCPANAVRASGVSMWLSDVVTWVNIF